MGMPVVLLPTQLLLVNLVTDGLPAIALGLEPREPEAMQKPPRRPDESFFSDGLMGRIFFRGMLIGICTLGAFSAVVRTGGTLEAARTAALCTLILSQLVHVFECKSERRTLFSMPYGNNLWLVGAGFCGSSGGGSCRAHAPCDLLHSHADPSAMVHRSGLLPDCASVQFHCRIVPAEKAGLTIAIQKTAYPKLYSDTPFCIMGKFKMSFIQCFLYA